jgi:hypothetical protein
LHKLFCLQKKPHAGNDSASKKPCSPGLQLSSHTTIKVTHLKEIGCSYVQKKNSSEKENQGEKIVHSQAEAQIPKKDFDLNMHEVFVEIKNDQL